MIGGKSLEVISPFKHFDPNYIIKNTAWDVPLVVISVVIILVSLAASYVLYARRNITRRCKEKISMNIFLREMRANLKSLLIWCWDCDPLHRHGILQILAYYNNPDMLAILDSLPPAVLSALNMSSFNLTTVTGFFGIMVTYFGLILGIAAAMWGTGVISKEERDKTVEFSLTLPVTRSRLVTAKTAAMVVNCILLLLVTWGSHRGHGSKIPAG